MAGQEELIVGLDIGTTKICAVVGEVGADGVNIVGVGTYPSIGLRKGVVVDIESTVNSIRKAVEEAELMAGCEISEVYVGIAGGHISSFNSHGVIAIKNQEVTEQEIERVLDAAQAFAIPFDREIIHIVPQEYIIDDQDGIQNPLGMSGVRLEVKVHIVMGAVSSAQNIVKCCNRAGLNVANIVLESIASSEAVLGREELQLGVALIDFGGGTTDLAIFSDNSIRHTAVLAIGGNNLTHDIALGLRTPMEQAERIKRRYGCALASMIDRNETIEVPSVAGRKPRVLSREILGEILEPRVEEIFALINREILKSGYAELLASGLVVTGGSSLLPGIPELAEQVMDMPVRLGIPTSIGGLVDVVSNPMYATGVGLVLYGYKHRDKRKQFSKNDNKNIWQKVISAMKRWFKEIR
ncbi:MAG: cell division protein FtsA [Deltaproteobacteria bacterium]|nr:MAG: cell division protein FtsA [Deltaproteobacteria bacterium]RLB04512.1 MAG: cell division protein FtsA [Deltaproteobacteria bacterium]